MRSRTLPPLGLAACGGSVREPPALPPALPFVASPSPGLDAAPSTSDGPSTAALAAAGVRVEIGENLDSEMRAVLSSEARRFRTCYAKALDRNPDLRGSMSLDVRLREGRPTDGAAIRVDETGDWRLVACIEDAVRDWAVPGAVEAKLAFVLRFSRRTG
ncbi:MAG: hypothetical protein VX000_09320 [Myxococcota bacterium]|nr:hypothetical protein [Myxococcota bacterium]